MSETYFWQRCNRLLGNRADLLFHTDTDEAYRGITVNERLMDRENLLPLLPFKVRPSGFAPQSFTVLSAQAHLGACALHHAGAYYVQEPSASTAAWALGVNPGDRVLDMCAAPGGKNAQLASALRGSGILVSNEYDTRRSRVLLSNSERMGATNAVILNDTPERIARIFGGWFNKVLVDAPCSGEGMFRKEPQAVQQHSQALVEHCAALQCDILDAAACCLCEGGELVYSTCTFSPEEDEGQIGAFLGRHAEFELVSTGLSCGCAGHENHCIGGPLDVSLVRRIYPCHGGEGHFVAKLRKTSGNPLPTAAQEKQVATLQVWKSFAKEYFPALAEARTLYHRGNLYLLPPVALPDMEELHVVRIGVLAGSAEKERFQPEHHLFHAYGSLCTNTERLSLREDVGTAYLRGEELAAGTSQKGWCAVLADGLSLGMGKNSAGRIKNHYPKGLRNLK